MLRCVTVALAHLRRTDEAADALKQTWRSSPT
jgi:hypothetical protein